MHLISVMVDRVYVCMYIRLGMSEMYTSAAKTFDIINFYAGEFHRTYPQDVT